MLTKFLSNRINLILLTLLLSLLMISAWWSYNIPMHQQVLMALIMILLCGIVYIIGVARGMVLAVIHRRNVENILKAIEQGQDVNEKDFEDIINKEIEKRDE